MIHVKYEETEKKCKIHQEVNTLAQIEDTKILTHLFKMD